MPTKELTGSKPQPAENSNSDQQVPEWKRCPRCWNPKRKDESGPGIGNVYAVRGRRRYAKCKRCGWTYSFDVDRVSRTVKIEYKEVELEER